MSTKAKNKKKLANWDNIGRDVLPRCQKITKKTLPVGWIMMQAITVGKLSRKGSPPETSQDSATGQTCNEGATVAVPTLQTVML